MTKNKDEEVDLEDIPVFVWFVLAIVFAYVFAINSVQYNWLIVLGCSIVVVVIS